MLDVPQGAVRLPASAHGQTLDLGEVALSDVQQGNLADCLGNNPRFMVALRGTNVGDDFVELLMDRGYSVDSLYWEGCTGISPAVMQLLRFEIPSADHLQVITPVIRRLACRGTIEMQAAIIPHLIPKNGQWTLELRGFTIIGSAESALLSALKDIAPYEKVIDLRGASVRRECLNELGHWQCVVDQTTDIVEPSPRKTSLT